MGKFLAAAVVWLAATMPVFAQQTEDTADRQGFDRALLETAEASLLEIHRTAGGGIEGPGLDRLLEEAESAQFFMIGEQHATADIAHVSASIYTGLAERGYDHMAIEVGPWSTRHVESLIRSGRGALTGYISQPGNGLAIPFLFFAEEAALVEDVVLQAPAEAPVLWGVDQEFIAAAPVLLPMLENLARTEEQRTAISAFATATADNPMAIGMGDPELLQALRQPFDEDADPEAARMIDELILSNRIYAPFTGRGGSIYPANLERENYMKRNFLEHFRMVEERDREPPRVFLKFGANHVMRGLSETNVPSLGNFLVEWGRSRGFGAVNVMIDCLGGLQTDPRSRATSPCESYSLDEGGLLHTLAHDRDVFLVDLRPLRASIRGSTTIDAGSRKTIFAFDYYLGIADVEPATPIASGGQ